MCTNFINNLGIIKKEKIQRVLKLKFCSSGLRFICFAKLTVRIKMPYHSDQIITMRSEAGITLQFAVGTVR